MGNVEKRKYQQMRDKQILGQAYRLQQEYGINY